MSKHSKKHHAKAEEKKCYYEVLQVERTAPLELIKQSYKKLALKYHPDKNEDKDTSKRLFTELSEAYAVLIDPKKRQMYDTLGHVDEQLMDFDQFDLFTSGHYQEFEQFIDEMMGFADLDNLTKMFGKTSIRKGARRAKHAAARQLNKLFDGLDEQPKKPKKKTEQKSKEDQEWQTESEGDGEWQSDSDDNKSSQDLQQAMGMFSQQLMFPLFVSEHSDMLKGKKKGMFRCSIDSQQLRQADLFDHFDDHHRSEYKKWCKDAA